MATLALAGCASSLPPGWGAVGGNRAGGTVIAGYDKDKFDQENTNLAAATAVVKRGVILMPKHLTRQHAPVSAIKVTLQVVLFGNIGWNLNVHPAIMGKYGFSRSINFKPDNSGFFWRLKNKIYIN